MAQNVVIDPKRAFTLFEGCPNCAKTAHRSITGGAPVCASCKDMGHRFKAFDKPDDLRNYLSAIPPWPAP
ncbi:MAG: hypothetical protein WBY94_22565 [Polyangiaceae bacterium]